MELVPGDSCKSPLLVVSHIPAKDEYNNNNIVIIITISIITDSNTEKPFRK